MNQESDGRDIKPEYDIRGGVRGKYFERYRQAAIISVTLEDSPFIAKGTAAAVSFGRVAWSVSYQSPNPSPTVQFGRLEPAEPGR